MSDDHPTEEFIAAVQRAFDCSFTAQEKLGMDTLGDVYSALLSHYAAIESRGGCVKMHVFNKVRRALVEGAGLKRADIKLDAKLEPLMPRQFRRSLWCNFMHRLPWDTSPYLYLRFPPLVSNIIGTITVLSFFALFPAVISIFAMHLMGMIVFITCIGLCVAGTGFLSSEPGSTLAAEIPEKFSTPRHITNYIATWNYGVLAKEFHNWNERELWNVLVEVALTLFVAERSDLTKDTEMNALEYVD
jgi:hypothetical protein